MSVCYQTNRAHKTIYRTIDTTMSDWWNNHAAVRNLHIQISDSTSRSTSERFHARHPHLIQNIKSSVRKGTPNTKDESKTCYTGESRMYEAITVATELLHQTFASYLHSKSTTVQASRGAQACRLSHVTIIVYKFR